MAFFGKKKDDASDKPKEEGKGGAAAVEAIQVSPDKAAKFFDHAKTVHEATNFEYAMQSWLSGLRQEPSSMRGLEGFWTSSQAFLNESGGKAPSKEMMREFAGRGDLEKYLEALLAWGIKPMDALLAVKAAETAAKLNMPEPTYWIGHRAMRVAAAEKKPRKELFLKLMDVFGKVGAFDMSVEAGEQALKLDPLDGKLAAEVRNLAAQATMNRGGYEQTGQAGGFKANVRNMDAQRKLEEGERIVKTDDVMERVIREAKADFESRPEDPAAASKYIDRLKERGRPEDEKIARELALKMYEVTKQFRFRQTAGELRVRAAARRLNTDFKAKAEAAPNDAKLQAAYTQAKMKFAEIEIEELRLRVEAYPTDLSLKFQLGRRDFDLGNYDEAIGLFQESQKDAKHRLDSLYYIGLAFEKKEWIDEAIHSFRQALEVHKTHADEMGTSLRYSLMTSLQTKAALDKDLALAEEADKLASSIAIQQINYRDIRARRDAIKKLMGELKRTN